MPENSRSRIELSVPRRLGEDIPAHVLSELARVVPAGVGLHLKLRGTWSWENHGKIMGKHVI